MNWIPLEQLLLEPGSGRDVSFAPALSLDQLQTQALSIAAALQKLGVRRVALYLEDAAEMAAALLGAWRAGVHVLLPADIQAQTRQRWADHVDMWVSAQGDDTRLADLTATPLPTALLDADRCRLGLCTSGSSGEPKLIDKSLRQLANEVTALEQLWGADLGQATILGSVAAQHIYGLLFRVLWSLCAGRSFAREQLAFPEDLQRASLAHAAFAWVASPALLKRMGDNLNWPALSRVSKVFSSGGALPAEASAALHANLGQWPSEIFGSSETGGIAWRQGATLWQPFAAVTLGLDADGALQVASPYLPAGHVEQTADAARLHADGRFELLGRLDRIVKLEEKRIALPLIERALNEHAWIAESRLGVIRSTRAYLGGLLVLRPAGLQALKHLGRKAFLDRLRHFLRDHCEAIALPRRWRLLQQLPLNPQGKLPQAEVENLLLAPRPKLPEVLAKQALDDGEILLRLQVPVDLAFFSGHFPQAPVLPGVVQVEWAMTLGRQYLTLPSQFAGMEVLKFQQLLRPGDEVDLSLRFDAERGKLYFAFRQGAAACSSGRLLLTDGAHGDA